MRVRLHTVAYKVVICLVFSMVGAFPAHLQQTPDTLQGRHLYRPPSAQTPDTIITEGYADNELFTGGDDYARMKFIEDSLLQREAFIRDSIARRQRILDSLVFLKNELPRLLKASIFTHYDDVILKTSNISIVGDTMLSNFVYSLLPENVTEPWAPWQKIIPLAANPVKIDPGVPGVPVKSIICPEFTFQYVSRPSSNVLELLGQGRFFSKQGTIYYRLPLDSAFFDAAGNVVRVKRYYRIYSGHNYQIGKLLYNDPWMVKQFEYAQGGALRSMQIVKLCDRASAGDPVKVCFIKDFEVVRGENMVTVSRKNDPANPYYDGTFTYNFNSGGSLQKVQFRNAANTESRVAFIKLNAHGHVSEYDYEVNNKVSHSLVMIYNTDNPAAKHKVEVVLCTYEDDGVCYFQKNNTTGKARTRNKITGEWGRWE